MAEGVVKFLGCVLSVALLGQLTLRQSLAQPGSRGESDRSAASGSGPAVPRVLRNLEPPDNRIVTLPGSRAIRPLRVSRPASGGAVLPASSSGAPLNSPGIISSPPLLPTLPADAPPATVSQPGPAASDHPAPTPLSPTVAESSRPLPPPALTTVPAIGEPLTPPAILTDVSPETPVASMPASAANDSELATVPDRVTPAPLLPEIEPDPSAYSVDFQTDSALFLQRQIGQWTLYNTRNLLGKPQRQRPALDDSQQENGQIYAFQDPTGRYQELELDFDGDKGNLRTVFVYPKEMTWQDCRRAFGGKVSATQANKGRTFYSYTDRRLDVLVAPDGQVISLGLY